jgi:hypothetical protein
MPARNMVKLHIHLPPGLLETGPQAISRIVACFFLEALLGFPCPAEVRGASCMGASLLLSARAPLCTLPVLWRVIRRPRMLAADVLGLRKVTQVKPDVMCSSCQPLAPRAFRDLATMPKFLNCLSEAQNPTLWDSAKICFDLGRHIAASARDVPTSDCSLPQNQHALIRCFLHGDASAG